MPEISTARSFSKDDMDAGKSDKELAKQKALAKQLRNIVVKVPAEGDEAVQQEKRQQYLK